LSFLQVDVVVWQLSLYVTCDQLQRLLSARRKQKPSKHRWGFTSVSFYRHRFVNL